MMRKRRTICVRLFGHAGVALLGMVVLLHDHTRADVLGGSLPAPRLPRDRVPLTSVEKLGTLMPYDSTLSRPPARFRQLNERDLVRLHL